MSSLQPPISPPTPSPRLPWELTDAIIDFLYLDVLHTRDTHSKAAASESLSACSTVCSQFLLRSRFHQFATIQLYPWRARQFFEILSAPGCTFTRVVKRVEVDDRARRVGVGGRVARRGSSSSRSRSGRSSWGRVDESRSVSGKREDGRVGSSSRTRRTRGGGGQEGEEETEYMRLFDILALAAQHHPSILSTTDALCISNVDWTALSTAQIAQLREHLAVVFPKLHALELHGATFHDMRELGRVVDAFEGLQRLSVRGTVFLKYPEHVLTGAAGLVLGRPGVLKALDMGRTGVVSGGADGLEVPALLTSMTDGLANLSIRDLRKAHASHVQNVFHEKGKSLEHVYLSLVEEPDTILNALDLTPLNNLRTLALHKLPLTSLASSALPTLLRRIEASFFDTIELGVVDMTLSSSGALPEALDCSALQKVLLEHRFFGLKSVRVVIPEGGDAVGMEGWFKGALPQLQGIVDVCEGAESR